MAAFVRKRDNRLGLETDPNLIPAQWPFPSAGRMAVSFIAHVQERTAPTGKVPL